jgi:ferredoxin, 2Fe-2S
MPHITYISPNGDTHTIDVPAGDSVMEGAIQNNIDGILAECGGALMCATCHVYVEPAHLDRLVPIQDDEEEMLGTTAADRLPNSRLSCQLKVTAELEGLIVRTAPRQK